MNLIAIMALLIQQHGSAPQARIYIVEQPTIITLSAEDHSAGECGFDIQRAGSFALYELQSEGFSIRGVETPRNDEFGMTVVPDENQLWLNVTLHGVTMGNEMVACILAAEIMLSTADSFSVSNAVPFHSVLILHNISLGYGTPTIVQIGDFEGASSIIREEVRRQAGFLLESE